MGLGRLESPDNGLQAKISNKMKKDILIAWLGDGGRG